MSDMQSLEQQIQQRLGAVEEKERSQQIQLQNKMAEFENRHAQFDPLADALMSSIIELKMEKLASFFDNAELIDNTQSARHCCACQFHHSDRYPATVKLTLSITHDAEIENLLLVYNLKILPIFFEFEGHDQIVFALDNSNQQQIADWVDEKILTFVDTYLKIEQIDQYQRNSLVTDPVCGMRFRRSIATAEAKHSGDAYFFCSKGCYEKFTAGPQQYISSKVH